MSKADVAEIVLSDKAASFSLGLSHANWHEEDRHFFANTPADSEREAKAHLGWSELTN